MVSHERDFDQYIPERPNILHLPIVYLLFEQLGCAEVDVELLYSLFAHTVRTALREHDDFSIGSCECARPNSYDSQQRQLGLMMMDVCCHPRIINAQLL